MTMRVSYDTSRSQLLIVNSFHSSDEDDEDEFEDALDDDGK